MYRQWSYTTTVCCVHRHTSLPHPHIIIQTKHAIRIRKSATDYTQQPALLVPTYRSLSFRLLGCHNRH